MILMKIFWSLFVVNLIAYFTVKKFISKDKAEDVSLLISMLSMSFLVVAIATKDPLFQQFGVPTEYEWIVGGFMAAAATWKGYLNPLKNKFTVFELRTERRFAHVETRLARVENDVQHIHRDIDEMKTDITMMKTDIHGIKGDLGFIKEKIFSMARG